MLCFNKYFRLATYNDFGANGTPFVGMEFWVYSFIYNELQKHILPDEPNKELLSLFIKEKRAFISIKPINKEIIIIKI